MRLVIDLQGAQTESRFRGIGRYSMSLTKEMAKNKGDHEIFIALNGLFPDTIEPIRHEFKGLLPQENIRVWYAPGPVRGCQSGTEQRRKAAELIREAFLASLDPDIIHIASIFEGYDDDAVSSIALFDFKTPVFVTLYDLIPLSNQEHYLSTDLYRKYYMQKIEHLKNAKGWLCISDATVTEAKDLLGPEQVCIENISTACDVNFEPMTISKELEQKLRKRFALTQDLILYTGGADSRKNLHVLIKAYSELAPRLRDAHQLVLAGKMTETDISSLRSTAKKVGIPKKRLIFTGYVTDLELVQLYNLCRLFVFPSWHEGFGLPVLEAMACGVPVVCGHTSSMPEVVCYDDAMFDPLSPKEMSAKIEKGLTDNRFRMDFLRHAQKQVKKFSWRSSAIRALTAFESFHGEARNKRIKISDSKAKPKLAYISPLPPAPSGIADYSAELLPELSKLYDIDVVVEQNELSEPWVQAHCSIRSPEWLLSNPRQYDRVLYHFGNSVFHEYMFKLIDRIEGVICLHDFFMSGYSRYMETSGRSPYLWSRNLYYSHGYKAVRSRFHCFSEEEVMYKYPCNFDLLCKALGIIVHSNYCYNLTRQWYGISWSKEWIKNVPFVRKLKPNMSQKEARQALGLRQDSFIICTFGMLAPTKLNMRLLQSWLSSKVSRKSNCYLIFVGENQGGEYGEELVKAIRQSHASDRVYVTGYVVKDIFSNYLCAADLAVQLRTLSRGETSAAVFDCMGYGLPTIVNANGSNAELPNEAVYRIEDKFEDKELVSALERLWADPLKRKKLGTRAREIVEQNHSPAVCAQRYAEALESLYNTDVNNRNHLIESLAAKVDFREEERMLHKTAACIAQNQPGKRPAKSFFVDISATCRKDLRTGIERVSKALLRELIIEPPAGYRIEPVYTATQNGQSSYRFARHYTLDFLQCPNYWLEDEIVEFQPGDKLLVADISGHFLFEAVKSGFYERIRNIGVRIYFIVFDLLPIKTPHFFPPDTGDAFESWLTSACSIADCALCISEATATDLKAWIDRASQKKLQSLKVSWFHLGADIDLPVFSKGLPKDVENLLRQLNKHPTFLIVGTIEPRKGHLQVMKAFELLWQKGIMANLLIVGKEGWKDLPEKSRRTIPLIVKILKNHAESNRRLFWLQDISDEFLERLYSVSVCLIAASEGEGFGLPLIEAARHNLPIIARDIPVFREIAGEHGYYFQGTAPEDLSEALKEWLKLYRGYKHPRSERIAWQTWAQSANQVKNIILKECSDII